MTERELMIECIPQITEMALEIKKMTPEQYRAKWGLPEDYPFVAPDYARQRSRIAKDSGLGRK